MNNQRNCLDFESIDDSIHRMVTDSVTEVRQYCRRNDEICLIEGFVIISDVLFRRDKKEKVMPRIGATKLGLKSMFTSEKSHCDYAYQYKLSPAHEYNIGTRSYESTRLHS